MRLFICSIFVLFVGAIDAMALEALPEEKLGGSVEAVVDGHKIHFPTLKTDVRADIDGDLATVKIIQIFANPTDEPLNATYLFPMNKDAAVYAMQMEVGDEIIQAQIQEKKEAKKTFEKAKSEGKAASLLVQHRPNMFTQKIANLMPGMPVTVTLSYTQSVPKIDGSYELVVPLVVGPRYQPVTAQEPKQVDELMPPAPQYGFWQLDQLPVYPQVKSLTIPETIDRERVAISIDLEGGMEIAHLYSPSHGLDVSGSSSHKKMSLSEGRVVDNQDFVLRYKLAGKQNQAGLLTHTDSRGNFFSLLIEPPETPSNDQVSAREMVFVLDTSGSMGGLPMQASKKFMQEAVKHLRSSDYFRIIRFGSDASEFSDGPVAATPANIQSGLNYVNGLSANGGTEMGKAITRAFTVPQQKNTMRIVVFLTDGYIGNEASVLSSISQSIGQARIYAFGVGTGVNRFLLSEMGRMGRGFARFIDPTEDALKGAVDLAARLQSPVLTDIEVDWGDLAVHNITPTPIPDLFAGDSIRIQGKFQGEGEHVIRVRGKSRGQSVSLPLKLDFAKGQQSERPAIALIWARSQIKDLMRQMTTPDHMRAVPKSDDEIKQLVTQLGLDFSLMTRWTSFVAVSKKIVNTKPKDTKTASVPLPMVKGVGPGAYGQHMANASNTFYASSVPEPETIGGLIVMGLLGFVSLRRRRRG